MNFKHKLTTTIFAASLALTSASATAQYISDRPGSDANTSETGITRTPHESMATDGISVRGEMDLMYVNYGTGDIIGFLRMDMDSRSTAELMVDMLTNPDILEDQIGIEADGTLRVDRDLGYCAGMYGDLDGMPITVIACADGRYVNVVMATDEHDALDVMTGVQQDGELVMPRGYEEWSDR